ncbi:MAG: pilin [Candidatus Azambacteria bacterium]|nr:pilin [Candidatus Azambacteria bacterium]
MNFDFLKGLVPCGTSYAGHACTICDFFGLIQNIINFLLYVLAPLATLAAIYIAFLFMFSGGSPAKITEAKEKLWLVIIGIFWVLGSWLVLNTVLNLIVNKGVFPWPWNQINCEVSQPTIQSLPGSGGTYGGAGASGTYEEPTLPEGTLSEQEARNEFTQNGITINKDACPSGVSYQNVSGGCTSLNGIKISTEEEAIQLKKDCNCTIQVTGGTELGHAEGTTSHASGDKLDLKPNSALDQYIQNNFTPIGLRSGDAQYRAPDGVIYTREGDHWDVTVKSL